VKGTEADRRDRSRHREIERKLDSTKNFTILKEIRRKTGSPTVMQKEKKT